ncbi:MAG: hypothetical protein M0T73_14435 [Deltaproteobacteria bacterium]|nr:hypothetical protein [Deltaproteobacteria bacterium]
MADEALERRQAFLESIEKLFSLIRASCKSVISAINQVKNELHGQARGIVFLEKDICHRSRQ